MKKWFTLVELIVVITIVAILSSIGFVAYTDYLLWVRDSNRIQQVANLYNASELYTARNQFPLSQWTKTIEYAGTIAWYQWDINQDTLDVIRYSDGGVDPRTKEFFTFFTSVDRKSTQILTFLENEDSLNVWFTQNTYALWEWLYPYVYWAELGVLIDTSTSIPIHRNPSYASASTIDIGGASNDLVAILTNSRLLKGGSDEFLWPNSTCKSHKLSLPSAVNGLYIINPSWKKIIQVYCNMELDGGGWTLVGRTSEGDSLYQDFWWMVEWGSLDNEVIPYSLWSESKNLNFSEIMLASYTTGKTIDYALSVEISDTLYIKDASQYASASSTVPGSCRELFPVTTWASACDNEGTTGYYVSRWGNIDYTDREIADWGRVSGHRYEWYYFRYYSSAVNSWIDNGKSLYWLRSDKFNSWVDWDLAWKNGMIFVR